MKRRQAKKIISRGCATGNLARWKLTTRLAAFRTWRLTVKDLARLFKSSCDSLAAGYLDVAAAAQRASRAFTDLEPSLRAVSEGIR